MCVILPFGLHLNNCVQNSRQIPSEKENMMVNRIKPLHA